MAEIDEAVLERVRAAYDAFNRGDYDASATALHPEIEWNRVAEFEQPLQGREAARENMNPEVFATQRTEVRGMEVIGDYVLVDTTFHAVGAGSGIELDQDGYHLWRIEDGLGKSFEFFLDRDEAVKAASG
jgi:ketosteroid isomerase-like protein